MSEEKTINWVSSHRRAITPLLQYMTLPHHGNINIV